MHNLFEYLKKIIVTAVILAAAYYIFSANHSIAPLLEEKFAYYFPQKFPELTGPVEKNFTWTYNGKQYAISQTLYVSAYEFYKSSPKAYQYVGSLPQNWEEDYYGMFLKQNEADKTIEQLAGELQKIAIKNKLSDDELVDLTVSFVQSIPYDDEKAKEILSQTGNQTMNYPYEVLFENKGVCSDKSILAATLFRQMGYGTALFLYNDENHMAVGIQCPQQYSNYDSGYCFVETTSPGNKIGIIPKFDRQKNKTVQAQEIAAEDFQSQQQVQLKNLGDVQIVQKTQGREYAGIVGTIKNIRLAEQMQKEMETLQEELTNLKKDIENMGKQLQNMKESVAKMDPYADIDAYNKQAKKYNALLEDYQAKVAIFNKTVNLYNRKVKDYNALINK